MHWDQCHQMAIYNNVNLPNSINICQIVNKAFKSCPTTFKMLPNWQKFAKSGHTDWDQ